RLRRNPRKQQSLETFEWRRKQILKITRYAESSSGSPCLASLQLAEISHSTSPNGVLSYHYATHVGWGCKVGLRAAFASSPDRARRDPASPSCRFRRASSRRAACGPCDRTCMPMSLALL